MSAPKFSKGPWTNDGRGLVDANGNTVSFVIGPHGSANKALRNAAPDLYDAAELALAKAERLIIDAAMGHEEFAEMMAELEPVRATLRKARGKQLEDKP